MVCGCCVVVVVCVVNVNIVYVFILSLFVLMMLLLVSVVLLDLRSSTLMTVLPLWMLLLICDVDNSGDLVGVNYTNDGVGMCRVACYS